MILHSYRSTGLTKELGVLENIEKGSINGESIVESLIAVSRVGEEKMGGTSGALYSYVRLILSLAILFLIKCT